MSNKMYNVNAYFLSKNVAELPVTMLNPLVLLLIIFFSFGFERSFEQFFLLYLILALLANVAQSLGYMCSAMFEQEQNALALAPLFVMPMVLLGGLMSNNEAQFDWLAWI